MGSDSNSVRSILTVLVRNGERVKREILSQIIYIFKTVKRNTFFNYEKLMQNIIKSSSAPYKRHFIFPMT
jgi:hypothetical protein